MMLAKTLQYQQISINMKSCLTQNPDLDTIAPVCCVPIIRMTRIIFFEFLAGLIVSYGGMTIYFTYNNQGQPLPISPFIQSGFIALAMFYAFIISGQLSGGQGNPIITIALIFTRGSNVTILNMFIYVIMQFAGSIVGGAIAYGGVQNYGVQQPNQLNTPLTFGSELLGSFMFIILYLTIMSASTKIQSNFWCYILVPAAFYISQMVTQQYLGLNPAFVLANQLFYGAKYSSWEPIKTYWAYICGPVVGSLAASIIFNYFLLPIHRLLMEKKK